MLINIYLQHDFSWKNNNIVFNITFDEHLLLSRFSRA